MVELPEATRIISALTNKIEGKKILFATVFWEKALRQISPSDFIRRLKGRTFNRISRRGKLALFFLDSLDVLIISFGMSGWLALDSEDFPKKHLVLSLKLSDGDFLNYRDKRKFGRISLAHASSLEEHPMLRNIGIEYDSPTLTVDFLAKSASRLKKRSIKEFLLDQRYICGIGNIYANESLFEAGIDPRRQAREISYREFSKIISSVRKVLSSAISSHGTTFRDFVDPAGAPGKYQHRLKVFMRAGKPCPRCGSNFLIRRINLGGRGTFFCENCQK